MESDAGDAAALAGQLTRVVGLLRTTPRHRLRAGIGGAFGTRADAGRALATALAIAVQGIEAADAAAAPHWRSVPRLPELAVGDQVGVTAHDYLTVMSQAPPMIWTPAGRASFPAVHDSLVAMVEQVAALW